MNKNKILTYTFLVLSLSLAFYLANSIYSSINESERITKLEEKVQEKLEMIRKAQLGYQAVNGVYTSDWDKLKEFVAEGEFYLTNKREVIFDLGYGRDSVVVEVDTLGTASVIDSLFSSKKYPNFDVSTLADVPGKEGIQFKMWADKIIKGGVKVAAVEVWNPSPIDPRRDEESDLRLKKPLRFGSRTNVSTAGNWE